jgi:hypothetical protein
MMALIFCRLSKPADKITCVFILATTPSGPTIDDDNCDVEFWNSEKLIVKAHKSVLSSSSTYFADLFTGNWEERRFEIFEDIISPKHFISILFWYIFRHLRLKYIPQNNFFPSPSSICSIYDGKVDTTLSLSELVIQHHIAKDHYGVSDNITKLLEIRYFFCLNYKTLPPFF